MTASKPSRFAEMLGTTRPVVLVTERGVEFDITDATLEELLLISAMLAEVDGLPDLRGVV